MSGIGDVLGGLERNISKMAHNISPFTTTSAMATNECPLGSSPRRRPLPCTTLVTATSAVMASHHFHTVPPPPLWCQMVGGGHRALWWPMTTTSAVALGANKSNKFQMRICIQFFLYNTKKLFYFWFKYYYCIIFLLVNAFRPPHLHHWLLQIFRYVTENNRMMYV